VHPAGFRNFIGLRKMSSYIVSARKYRPQKFSEVVGQGHVTRTLQNALKTDQLAHAFLFCGPRGVGKTTCARILARAINCQNPDDAMEPCGSCSSCISLDQNASFNIIELDAASHNSVDHIRSLNEQVRFRPQQGEYKVYIIDEVHMLSAQAFNAFLKTLEEPPPYAIFILATTEKHKIIPTILSRCQIFDFKRILVKDIVSHLEHICSEEGITAEKDALITIAQKCDGALRDALSLFDRLASVADKDLTYQSVVQNLNLLDYDVFFKIVDAAVREDVHEVLLTFDEVLKNGFEGDAFLAGLANHYRDLLVSRNPRTLQLQDHSEAIQERYQKQAQLMSSPYVFSALNIINETDLSYPQAGNKRLHVEMALAKICFVNRLLQGQPFSGTEEKKTADRSEDLKKAQVKDPAPTKSTAREPKHASVEVSSADQSSTPTSVESTPVKTSSSVTTTPATRPAPEKKGTRDAKPVINTPQLGSLTVLQSRVEESEKIARENSMQLTEENVRQWWNNYLGEITSPSVLSTFRQAKVGLEGRSVKIEVGSPLAKVRIQEESDLLTQLRDLFHDPLLTIDIDVNPDEAYLEMQKPKKLLTNKEKYEMLCEKNPKMQELRSSLDLIIDHED
jgi:DNA polymerase-3 subunit gamma/tau